MEDAFLALYKEFKELQALCSRQAELLQKLLSKQSNTAEMPISKPIQCTDPGDPTSSESPFFRLIGPNSPSAETAKISTEGQCQHLDTEEKPSFSFDSDVRFPPSKEQLTFLTSQDDNEELATGMSNTEISLNETELNGNFALFIKKYTPRFPRACDVEDKMIPMLPDIDILTMDPDHAFSLSNIYEELHFLQSKDLSEGDFIEPKKNNSNDVRGPTKSSWSPSCLSGECHRDHNEDTFSDDGLSSQICEFCQAVFPAGAATKGEYLQHLTGHVE
ncbi:TRAF family member-associated NF-kappa-B activator-like [Hyperolius riggenbachi]|uniref:TRAF family member-associated NF-kappa-B activator-like n=1 Tax=Hyperolius riggenbachi TaxID=752182 RepID=UPI0035A31DCF